MPAITELNIKPGELGNHWITNIFIAEEDDITEPIVIRAEEPYRRHGISSITIVSGADDEWFKILDGTNIIIGPCTLAKGIPWKHEFSRPIRATVGNALLIQTEADFDINLIIEGITDIYPEPATNPNPANGATGVSIVTDLSWDNVSQVVSHDVYLGTDSGAVALATRASAEFLGNQTANSYSPSLIISGTTYYWRIDEYDPAIMTKGDIWSFTTA